MTVPHHSEPAREAVAEPTSFLWTEELHAAFEAVDVPVRKVRMAELLLLWRGLMSAAQFSASPAPAAGRLEAVVRYYADTFCELGKHHECCGKLSEGECAGCKATAALASPAATSAEMQGGDGVREAREAFSNLLRYGARSNQAGSLQLADGTLFRFDDRSAFFLSDIDRDTICAALAPSTSAATRGEPVGWCVDIPNFGTAFFHDEAEARAQAAEPNCEGSVVSRVYRGPAPAVESAQVKFRIGDRVRKTKGSRWQGRVVGTYSTAITTEGYAVESETETGSVQIYPASALDLATDAE